ncbi:MAG: Ig-like domain-containing protein [Candidatus Micrarchaeota archaeon]
MKLKYLFAFFLLIAVSCAQMPIIRLNLTTNQTNLNYTITQENDSGIDFDFVQGMEHIGSTGIADFVLHKGPLAYVANGGVLIIDTTTHKEVVQLSLKYGAEQVAISPNDDILYAVAGGKQYLEGVGYVDQSFLTLVNTTTNEEIGYVDMGYNIFTKQVAVGPDGKVYVIWQRKGNQLPGYTVFDFKNNLKWVKQFGEYNEYLPFSFAFNDDGSRAFMGMYGPRASIYDLHWNENMAYITTIYPKMTALRAITATKNAQTIYYIAWEAYKIGYMRTSDNNLQIWKEDYVPTDIVYSTENSALYVVGSKNGVPKLSKITGLLGISTVGPGGTENFITDDPTQFYYSSQDITLSLPANTIPGHMELTPGGKYAYITNIKVGQYSESNGDTVVVYDAQTLQKVATINTGNVNRFSDIAIAKNPIIWDPAPDFELFGNILVNNQIDVHSLILTPYVMERVPAAGSESPLLNAKISVTYSKEINPETVNESTFIVLNSHYYPISGEREALGKTIYFVPSENYTANSRVFVALTDRITDTEGNPAAWDYYNFSTGNGSFSFSGGLEKIDLGARSAFRLTKETPELQLKTKKFTAVPRIPLEIIKSITNVTGNKSLGDQLAAISSTETTGSQEGTSWPDDTVSQQQNQGKEEQSGGAPVQQPGSDVSINPQPEPPGAQKGIIDSIVDFFRGLFGMFG